MFKDTASKHVSLIMNEIEEILTGKSYKRSFDLPRLMAVHDWEIREALENNSDQEVGRTVHILLRLQAELDVEQTKWASGYTHFDITRRLRLISAVNSERNMLATQLNVKAVEQQLTESMPAMFAPPSLRKPAAITQEAVQ